MKRYERLARLRGSGTRLAFAVRLSALLAAIIVVGTVGASAVQGAHPRPSSGTPTRVALLPAYTECTTGNVNSSHVLPMGLGMCSPGVLRSDIVRTGTASANSGFVLLKAICSVPGLPPCDPTDGVDEEDIEMTFFQNDVRCLKVLASGCPAVGGDYTGRLIIRSQLRITDHSGGSSACPYPNEGNPPCTSGTLQDTQFGFVTPASGPAACRVVDGTPTLPNGATCGPFTTTVDAALPSFGSAVKEFQRASWELFSIEVYDTGEDLDAGVGCPPICGTGDETKGFSQGIFAP
jgi:hypothetical protein